VRKELGIKENAKVLVFNFGGQVGHLSYMWFGKLMEYVSIFSCGNVMWLF
jgi:hypothetical protein